MNAYLIYLSIIAYVAIGFGVAVFHVRHWDFSSYYDAKNIFWVAWLAWPGFLIFQIGYQAYLGLSKLSKGENPFHAFAAKFIKD